MDRSLMSSRAWGLETVDVRRNSRRGQLRWLKAGLRQRFSQKVLLCSTAPAITVRAFSRYFPELARCASRAPADLFIGHNLPALPAAAAAARRWSSSLGFDAEDFHRGELSDRDQDSAVGRLTRAVEQAYFPVCNHLTAASDGIGGAYATALRIRRPITILNAFSLKDRSGHSPDEELRGERQLPGLSLYWYSQVIGSDRGLDIALDAMAAAGPGICLHVRGRRNDSFESAFLSKARRMGLIERIAVLPIVPPEQLVERAGRHDVGLALEVGHTANNRVAVSNKILAYFVAGLAIAATDVPGQRGIMSKADGAGFLFQPGDSAALAAQLRLWRDNPPELAATKARAIHCGETQFCWELEKKKLLAAVAVVLSRSVEAPN
jgi:glycosyltransferase involved in cell wall biosynthesis